MKTPVVRRFGSTALLMSALIWPGMTLAADYFVRHGGSDNNDGLSPASAFASVRVGGRHLLNPGDRLIVGPGDYFEGNVEPRRSGSETEPIIFLADTSGALSGDPAGEVRIIPHSDRIDETSGFLLYGKRNVRIEGFTVIGASNGGIETRDSAQTGGTSANIELTHNVIRESKNGIVVRAGGRVFVLNNEVANNRLYGISVQGEAAAAMDVMVSGNRSIANNVGILLTDVQHGSVTENQFQQGGASAVRLVGGSDLVVRNNIVNGGGALVLCAGAGDVTIENNSSTDARYGVFGGVSGALSILNNVFISAYSGTSVHASSLIWSPVRLEDNRFAGGGSIVEISGSSVQAQRNRIEGYADGLKVDAIGTADVLENSIAGASHRVLTVHATESRIEHNELPQGGRLDVSGNRVSFVANRADVTSRYWRFNSTESCVLTDNLIHGMPAYVTLDGSRGLVQLTGNDFAGERGIEILHAGAVLATHNQLSSSNGFGLAITASGSVEVSDNQISPVGGNGIDLHLDPAASVANIENNQIDGGETAISMSGARRAAIVANHIAQPKVSGVRVRNSQDLEIAGNEVVESGNDAISVAGDAILRGDCDRDSFVTSAEIRSGAAALFDDDLAPQCSAFGARPNNRASVASLVDAIRNAVSLQPERRPAGTVRIAANALSRSMGVGIVAFAGEALEIASNNALDAAQTGIAAFGTPGAALRLLSNTIDNAGADCVSVSAGFGSSAELRDNLAHNCGESGLRVRDVTSVSSSANRLTNAREAALLATRVDTWESREDQTADSRGGIAMIRSAAQFNYGSSDVRLEGVVVERSSGTGILLRGFVDVLIAGAAVSNSAADNVTIRNSGNVRLIGNSLSDAGDSAIDIGEANNAAWIVTIDGNQVSEFAEAGIAAHVRDQTLVLNNTVMSTQRNSEATVAVRGAYRPYCSSECRNNVADIAGNRIRGGSGDAIFVDNSLRAFVWDNSVFSAAQSGIAVSDTARSEVVNNLTYDNGEEGIQLQRAGDSRVFNNTSYGNGGWGLTSAGAANLLLFNNIFDANGLGGEAVGTGDAANVDAGYNLNTGAYGLELSAAATDLSDDPQFVDPDGADNVLGADGADDDNFQLRDISPAIDAGANTAEFLGISGHAVAGVDGDEGPTDLGFHDDAAPRVP